MQREHVINSNLRSSISGMNFDVKSIIRSKGIITVIASDFYNTYRIYANDEDTIIDTYRNIVWTWIVKCNVSIRPIANDE